jgi:hypothetical protein
VSLLLLCVVDACGCSSTFYVVVMEQPRAEKTQKLLRFGGAALVVRQKKAQPKAQINVQK